MTVSQITDPVALTRLSFQPEFMIWPDRNWESWNAGLPTYRYQLRLYYSILYGSRDRLHLTADSSISPLIESGRDAPPGRVLNYVTGQGGGLFPRATVALQGFEFEMPGFADTTYDGRYLKQLRFFVEPTTYNSALSTAGCYASTPLGRRKI